MQAPETRYVRVGDDFVAYQTVGEGPVVSLWCASAFAHDLDLIWDHPSAGQFLATIGAMSKLVLVQSRGTGASTPTVKPDEIFEMSNRDIEAVLEAIGAESVVVLAAGDSGSFGLYFAGTRPDLVTGLALINCYARLRRGDDYPAGIPLPTLELLEARAVENWGRGDNLRVTAPSVADDPAFKAWFAKSERTSTSPDVQRERYHAVASADLRWLLPQITAETVVIHRSDDRYIRAAHGRYLAEHIVGATYVEVPGDDHLLYVGDVEPILAEIEQLLTGVRGSVPFRSFATVLFSDVVNSTPTLTAVGDGAWRSRLDHHDSVVERNVTRFAGRVVKLMGDGFVATFDLPTRAARCAMTIRDELAQRGLEVRMGLHAAEIEHRGDDISGIGVHLAARIAAGASAGEILASRTVKDLTLGSELVLTDRGVHHLKGITEPWQLVALEPPRTAARDARPAE